jgi:hypothetical protein
MKDLSVLSRWEWRQPTWRLSAILHHIVYQRTVASWETQSSQTNTFTRKAVLIKINIYEQKTIRQDPNST